MSRRRCGDESGRSNARVNRCDDGNHRASAAASCLRYLTWNHAALPSPAHPDASVLLYIRRQIVDRKLSDQVGLIMEKTTNLRMSSYFHSIDKIAQIVHTRQANAEELQNMRFSTSRILHLLLSQDKSVRLFILKSPSHTQSLIVVLELFSKDFDVLRNMVSIFAELIGRSGTSKHCAALVSSTLTQTLFGVMRDSRTELPCDLLADIYSLLYKLGLRDKKRFGVKARLSQVLISTLAFVRSYGHIARIAQPALSVLKLCCLSSVNASYLSKAGAVSVLFKVLTGASRKSTILLKTALDALVLLVKSKGSAARAVNHDGVTLLLRMHCDWQRLDTKNRHVGLRKAVLNALRHLTDIKAGRRAVAAADGVRLLYRACQEIMDVRELESLIVLASVILRKCLPKHKLPASANRSALTFPLPRSELYPQVVGLGAASRAPTRPSTCVGRADEGYDFCSSSDDEVDDDDDVSSDDDVDLDTRKNESDDDRGEGAPAPPQLRSAEDLVMYDTFFPELTENQALCRQDLGERETAASNSFLPRAFTHIPTGASTNANVFSVSDRNARRLPPLCTPASSRAAPFAVGAHEFSSGSTTISSLAPAFYPARGLPSSVSAPAALHSLGGFGAVSHDDSHLSSLLQHDRDGACAAVNSKTGLPVFSLEVPPWTRTPAAIKGGSPRGSQRLRSPSNAWQLASLSLFNDGADPLTANHIASLSRSSSSGRAGTASALYLELAQKTRGVGTFAKIAFPDLHGHEPPQFTEPLYERRVGAQRAKIFEDIDRMIEPETLVSKIVYDLDVISKSDYAAYAEPCDNEAPLLQNDDLQRIRKRLHQHDHLYFDARFESGNLRKAIQVRDHEYDLILCPDVNTNHHHQWFYFEVGNMKSGVPYRFNIINNEKPNSQFNFGMQPVMFSVCEAAEGRPYWTRAGTDVCYYKNHFVRSSRVTGGVAGKMYYTTTFTVRFPHSNDVCYLAYHYPYTYTTLQTHIAAWEHTFDRSNTFFRCQELCRTLRGNFVPVLTITSRPQAGSTLGGAACSDSREAEDSAAGNRPYIFLSARVHPGESNASWIMKGIIDYILSDFATARALREAYVFKIVPMLNPDGVICGNHRSSLTGEDLNRRWLVTCPHLHPTVYHTKGLLQHMRLNLGLPVHVFCDLHGHSRRKNVFLYGCSPSQSWITEDVNNPTVIISGSQKFEDASYKALPKMLASSAPAFSLANCSYTVEKTKETTARVVVWRHLGIVRSYTMESTYCGCDQGPYNGLQINTKHLEEMGQRFAEALLRIKCRVTAKPASSGGVTLGAAGSAARDGSLYDLTRLSCGLEEASPSGRSDVASSTAGSRVCVVPRVMPAKAGGGDNSDSDDYDSDADDNSESAARLVECDARPVPRSSGEDDDEDAGDEDAIDGL